MDSKQTRTPELPRRRFQEIFKGLAHPCSGKEPNPGDKGQYRFSQGLVKYRGCVTKIKFVNEMSQGCDKRRPALKKSHRVVTKKGLPKKRSQGCDKRKWQGKKVTLAVKVPAII